MSEARTDAMYLVHRFLETVAQIRIGNKKLESESHRFEPFVRLIGSRELFY